MNVTVVWATPEVHDIAFVVLPPTATVADAVLASGLVARHGIDQTGIGFAIHGRRARPDTPLADGDRVELTRPLVADPRSARIRRARERPLAPAARRSRRGPGS
jgi:putative ubiquitin-RnfH superfamily antitoxin RatB of RatAB toxin-antitoxin module